MTEQFYYVGDEKVPLTLSTNFIAVQSSSETERAVVMTAVEKTAGVGTPDDCEILEYFNLIVAPTTQKATGEAVAQSTEALSAEPGVQTIAPAFQMPDGAEDELMILIPQFRVQFKPEVSDEEIEKLNKKYAVQVLAKDDLGDNSYLLGVPSNNQYSALELANLYHELDMTEYAEPDWVYKMNRLAPPSNDTFFSNQWALPKMNVPGAWQINAGDANIKIAIVDEGVQTDHPDLSAKIVTPYDAVGDDDNQEPNNWDGHGTACAGIAAAMTNNNNGVAGVARNCKIIPIRIAYSSSSNTNWTTNATWIARGIRRAVDRGADVVSNSWGGGPYNTTIRNAFKYAYDNGRDGKGCVIISASGNADQRGIGYPAKYPESMACGASNQWDQRKSKTSNDGEHWWGSNYGPEQDFVAPGVKIYTTDITAANGYHSSDYTPTFNGTSSATPNAAGVAALILSVDPDLRQWEVRDILRLTAKDFGPAGWDEQFGWGRLDAQKALQAARRIWYQAALRLEFLGQGEECYMRFQLFRLYNSGINRVRINSFNIRSYAPDGSLIDRFDYRANPGGVMLPGLGVNGGSGHDLRVQDVLLKANGNRQKYSYRWRTNWSYTYWRPSNSLTAPAATNAAQAVEEEATAEFEVSFNAPDNNESMPHLTIEQPEELPGEVDNTITLAKNGRSVKVVLTVE